MGSEKKILHQLALNLYRSWFIDFNPVEKKELGQIPSEMKDEIVALFPDSFEESDIGRIPKGWKWGTLLDISDIWTGGTPRTMEDRFWDGDIPWVSGADLSSSGLFI